MDSGEASTGDGTDWGDLSMFNTTQIDDTMGDESSPFAMNAFSDFTNLDAYGDSPLGLGLRTPSLSMGAQNMQDVPMGVALASAESSSQDSSSEASSRGKRKPASESPLSDPIVDTGFKSVAGKALNRPSSSGEMQPMPNIDQTFSQPPMHKLSLEQRMVQGDNAMTQFDFNSTASSPIQTSDFNAAMSLDAQINMPPSAVTMHLGHDSPVQTINPGMFAMGGSRDQSPVTNNLLFNQASPTAMFTTPPSDGSEAFNRNQNWNPSLQNQAWSNDFKSQISPSGAVSFTPSPQTTEGGSSTTVSRTMIESGISPLQIAPISTKSRVETQINIVMTLERPPPSAEYLHLPLHTIAKSKLLAKDEFDQSKVLELHTMLVCTSAMRKPRLKAKALQRAAAQNNDEIQSRAEQARASGDEDKNDLKNIDEADKPANGGEVRICSNCIQRERKRAGRKKTKREEEQQHWERYETERVVVFNSNEFLPFKPYEAAQQPARDGNQAMEIEPYIPPEGALQVAAAMRIACYCRHQSEKEGFQVIFTMKDQNGKVVAQQMSDSILITDDHKTHPPGFTTPMSGDGFHQNPNYLSGGLQMSQSMIDMTTHTHPFTSSRSAGNLQALAYGAQFNPHSHVHQLPNLGSSSQTTSATMTPTSLSRPASPSSAGQSGPNKKRKSASFHRKVPSGLTMTTMTPPRVDTSQPPSAGLQSAMSMNSQFSPSNPMLSGQFNQSYMTVPTHSGHGQFLGSGPSTPNEGGPFNFGPLQVDTSRISNNQAYFSHPSSAVPSRSNSPVLQTNRGNMAAYARQQPIQTTTNMMGSRSGMFQGQTNPGSSGSDTAQMLHPVISRLTPREGPVTGGTEVAIFGEDFELGVQVMFGDQVAPTHVLSTTSLIAVAPPGRVGVVHVILISPPGSGPYAPPLNKPVYRYTQNNEDMMVMALKFLAEQQYGHSDGWQNLAQQSATSFVQSRVNPAGLQQRFIMGHGLMRDPRALEELILKVFDTTDMSGSSRKPHFDLPSDTGATMLSMASALGLQRAAAGLLARGANVDVRDNAGYTPLMHASLHGRANVFQLLLARGADHSLRSLTGYSAIDLSPIEMRDHLTLILSSTQRRRHSRPKLPSRISYESTASSKASWDVAGASCYESDVDEEDELPPFSAPASRRSSTHAIDLDELIGGEAATADIYCDGLSTSAWRDSILVQKPPDDSQRLERGPQIWDIFRTVSPSNHGCEPPPAYHEIFPEREEAEIHGGATWLCIGKAMKQSITDSKCGLLFHNYRDESSTCATATPLSQFMNRARDTVLPSWLWVSFDI